MPERILIVAPSWVGDAILSEPLIARLRDQHEGAAIDVLAPAWCGPVYARMRGVGRVIANPIGHGRLDLAGRRTLARTLRGSARGDGYTQAFVLPNSWKSALVPWFAGIPRRVGYVGEARYGLLTDARRLARDGPARLVDRFVALALPAGAPLPESPPPVLVPDAANREAAVRALDLAGAGSIAILCPGAEYGPAKRWPAEHFAALARRFAADGMRVWLVGSPKDRADAAAVVAAAGAAAPALVDLAGQTDLGTAVDLLSLAAVVVSNDSGLMHAAAAVGVPLVALFGSSSPAYTPPLSPHARIAKIEIACSPCFKRECPLGHFRCLRELDPDAVYDLASPAAAPEDAPSRSAAPAEPTEPRTVQFSSRQFANVAVAAPVGRIDHAGAAAFEQSLSPLLAPPGGGRGAVVLDFGGVEYISSVGLRVLMIAAKQMKGNGGRLILAAPQPVVAEILSISRFDRVVETAPTVRKALEWLSPSALAAFDASPGAAS